MQFDLTDDQRAIESAIEKICARFGDDYWRDCEAEARFPREFHQAMAALTYWLLLIPAWDAR